MEQQSVEQKIRSIDKQLISLSATARPLREQLAAIEAEMLPLIKEKHSLQKLILPVKKIAMRDVKAPEQTPEQRIGAIAAAISHMTAEQKAQLMNELAGV